MARAGTPAPDYDGAVSSCFWRGDSWEIVFAAPDLPKLRSEAMAGINNAAGLARARYITIAPGQDAVYIAKAQQAAAFAAGGYTGAVPGLVQAEIDATGATAQQAADGILSIESVWLAKAAQIESLRRVACEAVKTAIEQELIDNIVDNALEQLALV